MQMWYFLISLLVISFSIKGQTKQFSKDKSTLVNYDSIKIELEVMYYMDQGLRKILDDSIGYNSPATMRFYSKMSIIDKINQEELETILKNYGWLPASKIGERASDAIFYVIQHSNIETMDKYFLELQKLAEIGEAKRVNAALMEDRLLMWKGKKQKYGTQANKVNGRIAIWPIEEPNKVDSLRKVAGFELSVFENARRLNAVYDPNEKLPLVR